MGPDPGPDPGVESASPLPRALLMRVEDAGINASAPTRQLWLDGWIVRLSAGKARRARCINAVACGERPVADKLAECEALYRQAGLPVFVRVTPFTQPATLDDELAARGWGRLDDTRVMVRTSLQALPQPAVPPGVVEEEVDGATYAAVVGALRGTPPPDVHAHAQRLASSPVPYRGFVWRRLDAPAGEVVACGQVAREGALAGLYDVFTAPAQRGRGFAQALCARLLERAREDGASVGYLQVDAANAPALSAYRRLGFQDAYGYHYRSPEAGAH
jgi:ribosomal protein S18 acetylase RimI-like enzyme